MKLQYGKYVFNDWFYSPNWHDYTRYYEVGGAIRISWTTGALRVMFLHLPSLETHWFDANVDNALDIEHVKHIVDQFVIRMNGLLAFI
jgi:hypothetical protein